MCNQIIVLLRLIMNFFILMGAIVFLQLDVCYTVSLKATLGRQKNNHKNISNLLDSLLRGYENSIRPNYGGAPAEVEVDFMVRSMGPISEVDMTYSMDCYFRQSWVDKRLAFPGDVNDTLALSISMLERIWKPDTYFHNGKQSYLHTITTPNKFVRLYQNGRVLYSSRLTIKAGCPMNLEDFPMDVQRCPLVLGSFGYTTRDVLYKWNSARQVAIAEDMKLSQFDLITSPSSSERKVVMGYHFQKDQEYTNLLVSFHLKRHMGNFLIQVYGPCVLLVVLSWVSFWLNREATADRVSLGITTVLTMTFLGLEARNDLPKVPYPTALDYFVFLSFAFIFATIIEFAVVHYFTKYGSGECYFSSDFDSDTSSDEDEVNADENRNAQINHRRRYSEGHSHISSSDLDAVEVIPLAMYSVPRRNNPSLIKCNCCVGSNHEKIKPIAQVTTSIAKPRKISSSYHHEIKIKRRKHRTPRFNSVSKIDRASRVVFPFLFLAINAFYWYSYLYKVELS